MSNQTKPYRLLTLWLLAAVVANLLAPAVMEAAQLFCKDADSSLEHSAEMHTSSCWMDMMDMGSDAAQNELNSSHCPLDQVCEQVVKSGLDEAPLVQHQHLQALSIPLTGSAFYAAPVKSGKAAFSLSLEKTAPGPEIYLLNSAFLN